MTPASILKPAVNSQPPNQCPLLVPPASRRHAGPYCCEAKRASTAVLVPPAGNSASVTTLFPLHLRPVSLRNARPHHATQCCHLCPTFASPYASFVASFPSRFCARSRSALSSLFRSSVPNSKPRPHQIPTRSSQTDPRRSSQLRSSSPQLLPPRIASSGSCPTI